MVTVNTSGDVIDGTTSSITALIANPGSDNEISLREAITAANNDATDPSDMITFDASLSGQTITLTGGELSLTSDLTINGDTNADGKADITISGNNASRIFNISGLDTDVDLESLTLIDGAATGSGGAILSVNVNSLDIRNSSITGSSATRSGGAAYIRTRNTTLTNTLIANNTSGDDGGGLYVYGQVDDSVATQLTLLNGNTNNFTIADTDVATSVVDGKTIATLTFANSTTGIIGGSLIDGNYTLTVDATKIQVGSTAMTADHTDNFFRYYGDVNGDRAVDGLDFSGFRGTLFRSSTDDDYNELFDFAADGAVDGLDFSEFRTRFFRRLDSPSN